MELKELIPSLLSPVEERAYTGPKESMEQIATNWLRSALWELPETKYLEDVRHNCLMAKLPFCLFLNGMPILFSEAAQKQWEDWNNQKFPYPPTTYWKDEHGQPVYFKSGQIIDIQVSFPESKQTARYQTTEDYGHNYCEMKLVED